MRIAIARGLRNLPSEWRGCVATIGNFDGVHAGHAKIIRRLAEGAGGMPVTVVTFEPLPHEFFAPESAPARLTRLRDKLLALAALPVDRLLILPFDTGLAALPAEEFVDRILVTGLGVRRLVIGDDFRFGRGRTGDFELLRRLGGGHGFAVEQIGPFLIDGERASSTAIRTALAVGEMGRARRLLGRPYTISGRVAEGDRRGRELGFPTANVHLGKRAMAVSGVFAVTTEIEGRGGEAVRGVANVGHRPTVGSGGQRIEVHLFDFDGDLYGRRLCIDLVHRLRDEKRFPSLDDLREQIARDAAGARAFFGF